MQLTLEQCEQQIAQLQQQIPQLQSQLQMLGGYKQALTEMEADKNPSEKEDAKPKKDSQCFIRGTDRCGMCHG